MIITSYLFPDGNFSPERLKAILSALGEDKSKLVLDLSCRKKGNTWFVAMNRWQTLTEMEISQGKVPLLDYFVLLPLNLTSHRLHFDAGTVLLGIFDSCSRC